MSTRYIWGKYKPELRYYWKSLPVSNGNTCWVQESKSYGRDALIGITSRPTLNDSNGKATYTGSYHGVASGSYSIDSNDYPWAIYATQTGPSYSGPEISLIESGSATITVDLTKDLDTDRYMVFNRGYTNTSWQFTSVPDMWNVGLWGSSGKSYYGFTVYKSDSGYRPGAFQQWLSSSRSSEYPNYDVDYPDGYFYYSEDQDVIDPVSVSIPDSILYDSDITISIAASEDAINNTYGNISYTYSYKFNDTDWTDIKTTSETTCSLRVPSGKKTVKVRVRAQDDIGFTSSTYVESNEVSVYASNPPSAPSSILVDRAIAGWVTKVVVGPATDTDGKVVSYVFERKTNSQNWTEIQNSNSLIYSEVIDSSWSTVQYRVKAVDDSGTYGPYIESDTFDVKNNILVIIGPRVPDFGTKIGTFKITFYVIVAGSQSNDISATLSVDSTKLYNGVVDAEQMVSVEIDTSKLERSGHVITITASKEGYDMASETYTFVIKDLELPSGGYVVQFQDSTGKPISPVAKAQGIIMNDGRDLETVIADIMSQISKQ